VISRDGTTAVGIKNAASKARREIAIVAATASMAAIKSPYAAGAAKADGSEGETTPGTRKLSPMNRNVCGTTNGISARSRSRIRSGGQMQRCVIKPKATKLIKMLSPNNA
jgi:hypothetical protein